MDNTTTILLIVYIITSGFFIANLVNERKRAKKQTEQNKLERWKTKRVAHLGANGIKASTDSKIWRNLYHNKEIGVIRVTEREYQKYLENSKFVVNNSGAYNNILGMYMGKKVMRKLIRKEK